MKPWQQTLLDAFLDGDDPALEAFRAQLQNCAVRDYEESEFGFLMDLWVEDTIPAIEYTDRFSIDDVFGELDGVDGEVCFLLHIVRGRIKTLEGYVSSPIWPMGGDVALKRWWYVSPDDEQAGQFAPASRRDLVFALRGLEGDGEDEEGIFEEE